MYEEDVPGYKSENVRKLPYYETGTRFTHPEAFPQLDALDEKLDIFNLHLHIRWGCVPKKRLPRLTRISLITTASIDYLH